MKTISDESIEAIKFDLKYPDYGWDFDEHEIDMSAIQIDVDNIETIEKLIDHHQATKELRWRSVEDELPNTTDGLHTVLYLDENNYVCIERDSKYINGHFEDDSYNVISTAFAYRKEMDFDDAPLPPTEGDE